MPWLRIFRRRDYRRHRKAVPVGRFTSCIYCACGEFFEGPSGGASQNVICTHCGARFNIGVVPGGPVLLDVLSGPKET